MNAAEILQQCLDCNVYVLLDGENLKLSGKEPSITAMYPLLRKNKNAIVDHLRNAANEDQVREGENNTRISVNFHFKAGGGGSVSGYSNYQEALAGLIARYGDRLDVEATIESIEERAAIMEFDGNLARQEAEQKALKLFEADMRGKHA